MNAPTGAPAIPNDTNGDRTDMQYLLMIYTDEAIDDAMTEAEMGSLLEGYGRFGAELEAAGVEHSGERLRPVATATSVRQREGEFTLTDGPFAETKEQLGGFYIIDAGSLDEAVEWAKKIPSVAHGTIEVRPVWQMGEDMLDTTDGAERPTEQSAG
ncbi:MAG: YciI family protein [Planctomycetota bacterium]